MNHPRIWKPLGVWQISDIMLILSCVSAHSRYSLHIRLPKYVPTTLRTLTAFGPRAIQLHTTHTNQEMANCSSGMCDHF